MVTEIIVSSAVALGAAAIIEGVKHACKRYLERSRENV